jgi:hypothetical protein
MDASEIKSVPTPVNVAWVHEYTKAVKDAKLSAQFTMAKVSRKGRDLLAECCENENLPSPVPNFLEINDAVESGAFVLLKPVMVESDYTIPVTVAKGSVSIDLAKLLKVKMITTVNDTRLVIPLSSVTIDGWGSALVLHMGALDWVPIKRKQATTKAVDDHLDEEAH